MMWNIDNFCIAPHDFWTMISKHCPHLISCENPDAYDLLVLILNALHADLSLVRKKPIKSGDVRTGITYKTLSVSNYYFYHMFLVSKTSLRIQILISQIVIVTCTIQP